jgi:hypothetical protein
MFEFYSQIKSFNLHKSTHTGSIKVKSLFMPTKSDYTKDDDIEFVRGSEARRLSKSFFRQYLPSERKRRGDCRGTIYKLNFYIHIFQSEAVKRER